jgi:predicted nucleotidyltransferase
MWGRFSRLVGLKHNHDLRNCRQACQMPLLVRRGEPAFYITGSFGRGEASKHSDLDLFIVGLGTRKNRSLPRLEEICIKADLIEATRDLGFPEFSGDGQYLEHYTEEELIRTLGHPDDDASNTFTARLLLLLESEAVLGNSVYDGIVKNVVLAYWRDYEDHKKEFIPAFLANDILRLWRTLCVNYEARTSTDPPEKKARRKLKNYKLKHSRLLTCYSALLYLLSAYSVQKTVHPDDALATTKLSPTARLEHLLTEKHIAPAHETIETLLKKYEAFLAATDAPEAELVERFLNPKVAIGYFESANVLGDLTFEVIGLIGQGNSFHRIFMV